MSANCRQASDSSVFSRSKRLEDMEPDDAGPATSLV